MQVRSRADKEADLNPEDGNGSAGGLEELTQRVAALEARMDCELTTLAQAIATALKFHEKVSERLNDMQKLLVEVGGPVARGNGDAGRAEKPGADTLAGDDELDAKILALRRKFQTRD